MKGTAAGNARLEKPVYQVILSWQSGNDEEGIPPDDPSREEMEEAADRVMGALGMEEHQAWMVAHRDTDTPHVHVMINRVHPTSKEVWKTSWSKSKIYECLRAMEEEKGWHRPAPMTIEEKWDQERRGERRESTEIWEEKKGARGSVRVWAREETLTGRLKGKESWKGAQEVLEGTRATLEGRRENGMVLKRDGKTVALSSIDPEISRPTLEERYGETWEEHMLYRKPFPRESSLQEHSFQEHSPQERGELTVEEYLRQRSSAESPIQAESSTQGESPTQAESSPREGSGARQEALDGEAPGGEVPIDELRVHREGVGDELKEVQLQALRQNRALGRINRNLEVAAGHLDDALGGGEDRSSSRAYEIFLRDLTERAEVRRQLKERTQKRRDLAREAYATSRVLAERTGEIEGVSIERGLGQARRRAQIENERKRRLSREAEVVEAVASAVGEYRETHPPGDLDNVDLGKGRPGGPSGTEGQIEASASQVEKGVREARRLEKEAERFEEAARERAGQFETVAEERGLSLEHGLSEERGFSLEIRQSEDPAQAGHRAGHQAEAERLGRRAEVLEGQREQVLAEASEAIKKKREAGQRLGEGDLAERRRQELKEDFRRLSQSYEALQEEAEAIGDEIERTARLRDETAEKARQAEPIGRGPASDEETRGKPEGEQPEGEQPWSEQREVPTRVPTRRAAAVEDSTRDHDPEAEKRKENHQEKGLPSEQAGGDVGVLRSRKKRIGEVQARIISETQSRVEYAERQGEGLCRQSLRMQSMTEEGVSTQQIDDLRRTFERRRSVKAKAEENLAQSQRAVQKTETAIRDVESVLEERGDIGAEDLGRRGERLGRQAKIASGLVGLEEERQEYAERQAEAMRKVEVQVEKGLREPPETFDPGVEAERYEQIADRSEKAQVAFREQGEKAAERAEAAHESAETLHEETQQAPEEPQSEEPRLEQPPPEQSHQETASQKRDARSQMKTNLQALARRERRAREAFEAVFENPEEAREAFRQEAYREGTDPRTRSFELAARKLRELPSAYGQVIDSTSNATDEVGEPGRPEALEALAKEVAIREEEAARARREFASKRGGRAPQEVAGVLDDTGERALVGDLEDRSIAPPRARAEVARALDEALRERASDLEKQFLGTAQAKFKSDGRVLTSFEENRELRGPEVARDVLKNPEAYRTGSDRGGETAFVDPGPAEAAREVDQQLRRLDRSLREMERRLEAYKKIEEIAQVQQAERQSREAIAGIEEEEDRPEKKAWDQIRVPSLTREEAKWTSDEIEELMTDLEEAVMDQQPQDQVEDILRQVDHARRREEATGMQEELDRALTVPSQEKGPLHERGPSMQEEVKKLQTQLQSVYRKHTDKTTADRKAQEGTEAILDGASRASEEILGMARDTSVPDEIQEAGDAIQEIQNDPDGEVREADEGEDYEEEVEEEEVYGADMIRAGLRRENEVLRRAGRLDVMQSAQEVQHTPGQASDRAQKVVRKARDTLKDVEKTLMETPTENGYNLRISQRASELGEEACDQLEARARTDPRGQEAIERTYRHRAEQGNARGGSQKGGSQEDDSQTRGRGSQGGQGRDADSQSGGRGG
jgi:hypothetical protein